jgi:hypothetical protein
VRNAGAVSLTKRPQSAGFLTGLKPLFWIPAAVGGVAGAASAFGFIQANDRHMKLTAPSAPMDDAVALGYSNEGKLFQTVAYSGLIVGVLGLAAGGAFFLLGTEPVATPQISVVPVPSGAGFVFSWVTP